MTDAAPRARRFAQVDVFASRPARGNPVAVVLDAEGLDDAAMARFARWTNLSETTFVLPPTEPGADYHVRIFTPAEELPFAGHPTIGTATALVAAGIVPARERIVQQCGVGLVELRRTDDGAIAFAAPQRLRTGPLEPEVLATAARAMGIAVDDVVAHEWLDNGPGWAGLRLRDGAAVRALEPDTAALRDDWLKVGVVGAQEPGAETAFEVRAFGPGFGEDPVTGSLNAAVAQWLIGAGEAPDSYVAAQGTVMGREGRVRIDRDGDVIWVGGDATVLVDGTVTL